jgi:LysR family transcriptional regulator, regulator for bpeEF and oprC
MDKLKAMQTFAKVAELGSFTKAAEQLGQPKGRVTQLVQQLEDHLRTKLLSRTTRRLSLTDDGTAYLQGVQRLLGEVDELEGTLTLSRTRPRGRLRVDVPASAGRHVIAVALPQFFEQYPDISVELGSSDRPVDLVLEGVDCVIRGGAVHDESLIARPLGALEVITCAAPEYLAKYGTPKTFADLQSGGHRAVNFFSSKTGKVFNFDFTDAKGETHEILLPHAMAANDADTYLAGALMGLGLAQYPRSRVLSEHLAAGRLVRVLSQYTSAELPLYVMYPRNRHMSLRTRVFVDWIVDLYAKKFQQLNQADDSEAGPKKTQGRKKA